MTGTERLRVALEHFKAVPEARVEMGGWLRETACGTVGCFCGHATECEALKAEGWRMSKALGTVRVAWNDGTVNEWQASNEWRASNGVQYGDNFTGMCSIMDFFEMGSTDARMFYSRTGTTKAEIVADVEAYLERVEP